MWGVLQSCTWSLNLSLFMSFPLVSLNKSFIFAGKLSKKIQADESIWTLEDSRLLRIQLVKVISDPTNPDCCWPGLLEDQVLIDFVRLCILFPLSILFPFSFPHSCFQYHHFIHLFYSPFPPLQSVPCRSHGKNGNGEEVNVAKVRFGASRL